MAALGSLAPASDPPDTGQPTDYSLPRSCAQDGGGQQTEEENRNAKKTDPFEDQFYQVLKAKTCE